jgi:hypothetical protein
MGSAVERHSVRPSTGLTRRQLFGVLGVALAIFAVGAGPVWRDPWNIDSSILLSYVVLPPMVLAVLLVSRRFTWRDFALDTLTLTCTKFGVTYIAAAAIWAVSGEPPPLERSPPPDFPRARVAVPPAVAPSDAATVEGIVAAAGAPRAGAVVWVERGAEGHAYPTRSDVIELVHDGRGFVPAVAALQAGEPLRLRSASGQMHAVRGMGEDGRSVFNLAVTQVSTLVRLNNAAGVVTLTCAVQAHAGKEQPGRLVLLAHPFFVTTVADGRFRFEGLPRGEIVLRALDAELGEARQTVELPSRRSVTLTFTAARSP